MDEHRVDLADAIEAIRSQLVDAAERGAGSELAFEVGDIQLEFNVQLSHDQKVKGGVKAWVLTAGYESARNLAETQRVSVTLSPKRRATGERVTVGNDAPANLEGF